MTFLKKIQLRKEHLHKKVVKDFLAVVGSNLAIKPILFLKGFIVAKYLGPGDYGILKTVELIQLLNKYGSLGFNMTAAREVGNAIGAKNKKIDNIRNTAFSSEIILSIFLFIIGISSSLFFSSSKISILIILASFGLLASKLRGILATEAVIQKKFVLTSKITFLTTLIASIVVIITVPFYKIYAVLFTNILVGAFAIIFYYKPLNFKLRFRIDPNEFKRILKISIPLTLGTLSLASFVYTERILIIKYLNKEALGYISFAAMIAGQVTIIFKSAIKVRIQDIYEKIGKKEFKSVHNLVKKETFFLTLFSLICIPILWYSLEFLIPVILPKWLNGVYFVQLYLFTIPFEVILNYPSTVLISKGVNKQNILPLYRFLSTVFFIIVTFILVYLNHLTIANIILIRIGCLAYYNIVILVLYKKYFYNSFVKQKS